MIELRWMIRKLLCLKKTIELENDDRELWLIEESDTPTNGESGFPP